MSYDILAITQDQSKIAQLTGIPLGGTLSNGTGVTAGVGVMATGVNTITVTTPGTFVITMPSGSSAVVATGTGPITASPVAVAGGKTVTVEFTGVAAQNFTVTVTVNATASIIEIPGIRTIQAVIGASLSGGYKIDPAACSWAGNKVTIQPQYFDYAAVGAGPAIAVPVSVDLSAILYNLTVIGY